MLFEFFKEEVLKGSNQNVIISLSYSRSYVVNMAKLFIKALKAICFDTVKIRPLSQDVRNSQTEHL